MAGLGHRLRALAPLAADAKTGCGRFAEQIAGPKGAGKTTRLVHLVRGVHARFVANDRVVIPPGSLASAIRGLPTIVKLRRESVDRFPDLRARLEARRLHHRLTLAEARHRPGSYARFLVAHLSPDAGVRFHRGLSYGYTRGMLHESRPARPGAGREIDGS